MKIEKRPKTGGRKPGSVNKTTAEVKSWVMQILTENQESFEANLKIVDPEKHIEIIQKLLQFVLPKAQQIEITEQQPIIYKINVVDQETKIALEKITSGNLNEPEDSQHKIEVGSMETAQKLARWLNDEPMESAQPEATSQQAAAKISSWLPPMEPEAIEPPAQPAPEAPAPIQEFRPVTYPTRSAYRRTHI